MVVDRFDFGDCALEEAEGCLGAAQRGLELLGHVGGQLSAKDGSVGLPQAHDDVGEADQRALIFQHGQREGGAGGADVGLAGGDDFDGGVGIDDRHCRLGLGHFGGRFFAEWEQLGIFCL